MPELVSTVPYRGAFSADQLEAFHQRVIAGAKMLDEKHPGWYFEIDTMKLDIRSSCHCIAGQLYYLKHGDTFYVGWSEIISKLFGDNLPNDLDWQVNHGLAMSGDGPCQDGYNKEQWALENTALVANWYSEILARMLP